MPSWLMRKCKMIKLFPKDCDVNCRYYSTYDLNVDDYVATCELLNSECDLCDQQYSFLVCPLKEGDAV